MGVTFLDQVDLPLPVPTLQLLFPRDGAFHVTEEFETYEHLDIVPRGEAGQCIIPVLREPGDQVGSNANINCAIRLACEDVGARLTFLSHGLERVEKWILKQVQDDEIGQDRSNLRD